MDALDKVNEIIYIYKKKANTAPDSRLSPPSK